MDKSRASLARQWLMKARHDLDTARIIAAAEGPLDTAIWHTQQAAEKAIKGWLAGHDLPFEKTHDLLRLVRQAEQRAGDFATLREMATMLTPYATAYRYPGLADDSMPELDEFREALAMAISIFDFVTARLPSEALPD